MFHLLLDIWNPKIFKIYLNDQKKSYCWSDLNSIPRKNVQYLCGYEAQIKRFKYILHTFIYLKYLFFYCQLPIMEIFYFQNSQTKK